MVALFCGSIWQPRQREKSLVPKLKFEHVYLNFFAKMRVDLAGAGSVFTQRTFSPSPTVTICAMFWMRKHKLGDQYLEVFISAIRNTNMFPSTPSRHVQFWGGVCGYILASFPRLPPPFGKEKKINEVGEPGR